MKTKLVTLSLGLLLVCLVTAAKEKGTSLLSGNSLTELGQYTITTSPVITQNPKTEEELLGLIACYFSSLIKEEYLAKT